MQFMSCFPLDLLDRVSRSLEDKTFILLFDGAGGIVVYYLCGFVHRGLNDDLRSRD